MNPKTVAITKHAWQRFITRIETGLPKCPMGELHRLLHLARREDMGYGAVIRLLRNGLVPASYYTVEGWRFILDEEEECILTIERVIHKKRIFSHNKRRRRQ